LHADAVPDSRCLQAGSAEWNGIYTKTAAVFDGRPVYRSSSTGCPAGTDYCALYSYAGTWRLGITGKEIYYLVRRHLVQDFARKLLQPSSRPTCAYNCTCQSVHACFATVCFMLIGACHPMV